MEDWQEMSKCEINDEVGFPEEVLDVAWSILREKNIKVTKKVFYRILKFIHLYPKVRQFPLMMDCHYQQFYKEVR